MNAYLEQMRVTSYAKGLVILLPLFFAGSLFDTDLLFKVLLGVASFCLLSSAIYTINDMKDVSRDRNHATKSNRPLASGRISPAGAKALIIILLTASLCLNYIASSESGNYYSWIIMGAYITLNIGYSCFGWKNIPVIDIGIIASGFLLRLLYGSALTGIEISSWLALAVISISFYFSLVKRREEKVSENIDTRDSLKQYDENFLNRNMYMCLALSIVFYALWSVDATTIARLGNNMLVWTVPLIMIICMRYNLIAEMPADEKTEPLDVLLKDKLLICTVLVYLAILIAAIYGDVILDRF